MKIEMNIIMVDYKTNNILDIKKLPYFPYLDTDFMDENNNIWKVKDISIDLLNAKMHIYVTQIAE
jgi:hypothetical protein